jgi:hypothetical protein
MLISMINKYKHLRGYSGLVNKFWIKKRTEGMGQKKDLVALNCPVVNNKKLIMAINAAKLS